MHQVVWDFLLDYGILEWQWVLVDFGKKLWIWLLIKTFSTKLFQSGVSKLLLLLVAIHWLLDLGWALFLEITHPFASEFVLKLYKRRRKINNKTSLFPSLWGIVTGPIPDGCISKEVWNLYVQCRLKVFQLIIDRTVDLLKMHFTFFKHH